MQHFLIDDDSGFAAVLAEVCASNGTRSHVPAPTPPWTRCSRARKPTSFSRSPHARHEPDVSGIMRSRLPLASIPIVIISATPICRWAARARHRTDVFGTGRRRALALDGRALRPISEPLGVSK